MRLAIESDLIDDQNYSASWTWVLFVGGWLEFFFVPRVLVTREHLLPLIFQLSNLAS